MADYTILTINPGSTSTKIAVYENNKMIFLKQIQHTVSDLERFSGIIDQYEFRRDIVLEELRYADISLDSIHIVVGRGGLLKPVEGGVYRVNDAMLHDIEFPMAGHVSNLGGYIAYEIAKMIGNGVEAFIADPTSVDELDDIARISGLPEIPRRSFLHSLNQKAVARRFATEKGGKYEDYNLIVAHMGGGITVGAHKKGRIVDVNNGLNGDGPFSPERAGGLPSGQLAELCFSGKYTLEEIKKMLTGKGGLVAYLGTNNAVEIEARIEDGDRDAELILFAMAYQVSKEIGAMYTVLNGEVDAIILTGGLAFGKIFVDQIIERVNKLAQVLVFAGEDEMQSLASNGLMVLKGEIEAKEW
ncbi:MAG: butyrate kinase, partial [Bacteroidota bacterium]